MHVKTIYTCDRCGKEFEVTDGIFRVCKPKRYLMNVFRPRCFYEDRYDLCDDCKESFESWLCNPEADVCSNKSDLSGEAKDIYDGMLKRLGSGDEDDG